MPTRLEREDLIRRADKIGPPHDPGFSEPPRDDSDDVSMVFPIIDQSTKVPPPRLPDEEIASMGRFFKGMTFFE